jgi:hypothetical protein
MELQEPVLNEQTPRHDTPAQVPSNVFWVLAIGYGVCALQAVSEEEQQRQVQLT